MQALFYMDTHQRFDLEMLDRFCISFTAAKKSSPFFKQLVSGVVKDDSRIDSVIARFSDNWKMNRMSCVDRNVMRIAVYEMLSCSDIPMKVSINEAVDVGKKFGSDESGAFINGILDSIRIALEQEGAETQDG